MLASIIWLLKLRMIKLHVMIENKVDMKKQRLDFSISLLREFRRQVSV